MKKTNILFLLTLLMSMVGVNSFAHDIAVKNADGVTIYYIWSKNKTELAVSYSGSHTNSYSYTGDVVIPEFVTYNGKTYPVTSIGDDAFYGCTGLTSITIPNSVTSIGVFAFMHCTGLTNITIPNSVTSIGDRAFYGCTGLNKVDIIDLATWCKISYGDNASSNPLLYAHHMYLNGEEVKELVIPNSVTSIGKYAFYGCTGLTSITIPNSVTSINSYAFKGCTGLIKVTLHCAEISSWFSGFSNIKEVVMGNDVTGIGNNAFSGCSGLTSITIPNSVTTIGSSAFSGCSGLTSITIPNSVTNIGYDAFYGCTGLTSITIPNSVTTIGSSAFEGCTGLTNITIPNSVTSIGRNAFKYCTGLTSITIPNSVTSIGDHAFEECTGLTNIAIPGSVTNIGYAAFSGCSGLTSFEIPNSVTTIGGSAFSGCTGITSLTFHCKSIGNWFNYDYKKNIKTISIGNEVEEISSSAFSGFTGLTSVIIPNSITSIGKDAFYQCTGLNVVNRIIDIATWCKADPITYGNSYSNPMYYAKELHLYNDNGTEISDLVIPDEVTSIRTGAFSKCINLKSVTIPNSVMTIGNNAFSGCMGMTKVTLHCAEISSWFSGFSNIKEVVMGNDVTGIGNNAFKGCTGLTNTTIPNSVTTIGSSAFEGCTGLTSITIPNSVTSIGDYVFKGCTGLTNITIPNSVTTIGSSAFEGCTGLTSITIPNSVTSIGDHAFYGCKGLASVDIPNDVTYIGSSAFDNSSATIYVKRGTKALLALWSVGIINPYEKGTNNRLRRPEVTVKTTQTTVTFKLYNYDSDYTYTLGSDELTDDGLVITGVRPEVSGNLIFRIYWGGYNGYSSYVYYTTSNINPSVYGIKNTASSMSVKGSHIKGDAQILSYWLEIDGIKYDGDEAYVSGLEPNRKYNVKYNVKVAYGENGNNTYIYTSGKNISTKPLTLITSQPKVVSMGNVIVAAESNLDDEETNVGFEWRRTDWTNEFASNTGDAALYEGTMEGYIRNLNTEKLWKFRPYYLSNSGTYYYGDWVGLDPTNTSYFEPTVHTYSKITIEGNTALVKGYALGGTDKVMVQGFKYWKNVSGEKVQHRAVSIPANAMMVEAKGQVMTAELTGLDYNTDYSYVAFVKTAEGETFYGEEQMFTTPMDPTGIDDVIADAPRAAYFKKGVYTLTGVKLADDLSELQGLLQGVYIINGKKVMVK